MFVKTNSGSLAGLPWLDGPYDSVMAPYVAISPDDSIACMGVLGSGTVSITAGVDDALIGFDNSVRCVVISSVE